MSGTLVEVDLPLDQAEVEHDYRHSVPLQEIPDSPPSTIAESFFEGPAITQEEHEEHEEVDRRVQESDEDLGEMVFNVDVDALHGGSF